MADTYLRIIPVDPSFVPKITARERAVGLLRRAMPLADDVTSLVSPEVRFVDCGADFESVRCPVCGADLGDWWSEVMEIGQAHQYRDLRVTTPCCGSATALNDLVYSAPSGFARYVLEALNPGQEQLPEPVRRQLERALGSALRVIWAHY